jgi:hypothetical protein
MKAEFGQRIVYQTDDQGFYIGETIADPDPLTPGRWLLPRGAIEVAPPKIIGAKRAQWDGFRWKLIMLE